MDTRRDTALCKDLLDLDICPRGLSTIEQHRKDMADLDVTKHVLDIIPDQTIRIYIVWAGQIEPALELPDLVIVIDFVKIWHIHTVLIDCRWKKALVYIDRNTNVAELFHYIEILLYDTSSDSAVVSDHNDVSIIHI